MTPKTNTSRTNVSTLLDANLEAGRATKVAAITDDGAEVTFEELFAQMCSVASRLSELGIGREDRVLLVLDDTPAFPAAFLGAMRIGAVPIPANFLARPDDFAYFLDDSYAAAVVVDAAFVDKVEPFVRSDVAFVVTNGASGTSDVAAAHSLDEWMAAGGEIDPIDTHPEDMAFWLYSSGSTGRPKGVVHTHADLWFTCDTYAKEIIDTSADDIHFSTTKMFHAYGLGNSLSFPLWSGATSVYMTGRPLPDKVLEKVSAHHPTILFSVPTLFNAMLASPGFSDTDFTSLRLAVSAAEPLPPEVWRRFHDATGIEILDGIGSTEMLHIYCSNRLGQRRPGTSGTPVPGYEVEIRNEQGEPVGPGEPGQLMVRGGSMLSSYWHQRAKSRASLLGEWFATGDRYHRDADGCYSYQGRMDDMMKVGGLWVSPIEIENRLMEHAAVVEAAVVGVDVDGLMQIKAYVISSQGGDEDLSAELRTWCKDGLQRYQYPHLIEFVEDFPRTTTGKIQRFVLRSS